MYQYIAKRVLLVIPTLIGAAALVFILMRLIPGDICVVRLGSGGSSFDPRAVTACHAGTRPRPAGDRAVPQLRLGILPLRLRHLDVVRQAGVGGDPHAAADLAGDRAARHRHRDPDRDPAGHHLGAEAEHLDRRRGAHARDRRHRHAVVLAGHHLHPVRARRQQRDHRHAVDAADRLCADLEGSDPQPVDGVPAGDHRRLSLCRRQHAHDPLGDA